MKTERRGLRVSRRLRVKSGAFLVSLLVALPATAGQIGPSFSKSFLPGTMGPGSTSTLEFDIFNDALSPVTDLAFTDNLPAGVVIAIPSSAFTDCAEATLSAPDGGTTISFTGGQLGANDGCTVVVNVTSSTVGTHTNVSGDLTSSAGNSGPATADLIVATDRPGFRKSFAPSSVNLSGRSTLSLAIDNTANPSTAFNLNFTDNLPTGMVIAGPSNSATDCTGGILTASPGTSVISYTFGFLGDASVAAGASCAVDVDVIGNAVGLLGNTTGELTSTSGQTTVSSGKASAVLEVAADAIALSKNFTDDPVPPGSTVTLEFTIVNFDRDFAATNIGFTDDLDAVLSGLVAVGLPAPDVCGAGSSLTGTGLLTLSGGNLPAQGSCAFSVTLQVPAAASPGVYTNTTSSITADVEGTMVTGSPANEDLFVQPAPLLTKEFLDAVTQLPNPVINAGDDVIIRFTIDNTSTSSGATDIAFIDELTTFLPFPVTVTLPPNPPCGAGSLLDLVILGTDRQGLSLTGGSLAAAPGAGSSCAFEVTLTTPVGLPPGVYVNTTEEIAATVNGETVVGAPASDDFTVIAAPQLVKAFTDDPVAPGSTVTLEFTLVYRPDATGDATAIAFTDDLAPVLAGLTANLPPTPDPPCGPGSSLTGSAGDALLTMMGGTLMPGESCTFSVTLDVPASAASGSYTNTTSGVTATVGGLMATSAPAAADLRVAGLTFTKEFIGDPVLPGDTVTLRFAIANVDPINDATGIVFTDNLSAVLAGLVAIAPLPTTPCGPNSAITGTNFLIFDGGNLMQGEMCTFDVTLQVPAGAADGNYRNTTSILVADLNGTPVTIDPATDSLTVDSNLLGLTKEFTDDPVAPGGTATLEFTLTNLGAGQPASAIDFTDDLGAALPGLTFSSLLLDTCGGTVSGVSTTTITVTGASLAAGGTCTIRVSVTVPGAAAANIYINTTSGVNGTITGFPVSGDAASDELVIVDLLQFSKAFDGPTTATGTPVLSFTITNPTSNTSTAISFSDDLDDVIPGLIATNLPLADVCGAGSLLSGSSFLTLTDGNLPPSGGTCSFDVDLLVPGTATAGTFTNTTSDLFQAGLPVAEPATSDLTVEPPPAFSKIFEPDPIGTGEVSTLTFTIDNTASSLAASRLDFTDNLPAPVVVGNPPNVSETCSGGTVTAVSGTNLVTYTGGAVAAGGSCSVQVDVTSIVVGTHVNTTGDLTSSSGNSGTATATLTVVDVTPPTVTNVDSVPGTGDGQLEDCETAQVSIRQLLVSFSEPVQDPPGDTQPDDVTNPANYLLVASGPDNDIQTPVCGTVMGDDVAIPISGVTYDAGIQTANLDLGSILPDSLHRLLVCSSTSIRDIAGNALDGDGDGMGGDDYHQIFRSDPANLLANGHFDCSLVDWIVSETIPGAVTHSTEDVNNSSLSGSAEIFNPSQTGNPETFSLAQCVPVKAETALSVDASTRLAAAPGVFVSFIESCEFFDLAACGGSSLGVALNAVLLQDTAGLWIAPGGQFAAPVSAASALCMFQYIASAGEAFSAFLDDTVVLDNSLIFADGFESGDTSAWSATVP